MPLDQLRESHSLRTAFETRTDWACLGPQVGFAIANAAVWVVLGSLCKTLVELLSDLRAPIGRKPRKNDLSGWLTRNVVCARWQPATAARSEVVNRQPGLSGHSGWTFNS